MNNLSKNSTDPAADLPKDTGKPVNSQDLSDSLHDEERMKEEIFTIDLPDVSDIPGQEHIHVPNMREMADTTISSDDEEGVGLFNDEDNEGTLELEMGNEADVNTIEKNDLRNTSEDIPSPDNTLLREAALDNNDLEGAPLNESSSATKISGKDLDIPGADDDDTDEAIGEEDEENNSYSLGADDNDEIPSDSF